jgi:hypothetical protein
MTVVVAGVTLLFTQEQFVYSSWNPWPPRPPEPTPTLFVLPSLTPTFLAPTPLPTMTSSPEPPTPTLTPFSIPLTTTPTIEGESEEGEETPTISIGESTAPTATPSSYPFTLQDNAVTYIENQNEDGCAWQSIAGQVLGMDGDPIRQLPVQVTGENFEWLAFTGSAPEFGPSGYEVWLNNTPLEAEYEVQLLNTTGLPLSEVIVVQTLSACERNVAIVNFVQNHEY